MFPTMFKVCLLQSILREPGSDEGSWWTRPTWEVPCGVDSQETESVQLPHLSSTDVDNNQLLGYADVEQYIVLRFTTAWLLIFFPKWTFFFFYHISLRSLFPSASRLPSILLCLVPVALTTILMKCFEKLVHPAHPAWTLTGMLSE